MNAMFLIASVVAVVATLMVITRTNAVHALLYLIVSLFAIAVIFFILGAPFVAVIEIIIYAGAIMVLFIFVIMMLNLGREAARGEAAILGMKVWIGPLILTIILASELLYILTARQGSHLTPRVIASKEVGISLFTTYLLGVEMAGLLLLAGIVGAYHLGRTRRKGYHRFLKGEEE